MHFVASAQKLTYPYTKLESTVDGYIDINMDLDANFSLNSDTHLLQFELMRYNTFINHFDFEFSNLLMHNLFLMFKPEEEKILLNAILPFAYKLVSKEINYRLQGSYESEI